MVHKGDIPWNKGIPSPFKGIPRSKAVCEKVSKSLMGHLVSIESRQKMSKATKGKTYEERYGIITATRLRKLHSTIMSREKHWAWKGGIADSPYPVDWTNTLRRSIRERDKYTCQLCSNQQSSIAFHIHHIDYDKKNCNPNNLITLCIHCHIKTNYNRLHWEQYFKRTMEIRNDTINKNTS